MRELKFRAWLPAIKTMTPPMTIKEIASMEFPTVNDAIWLQYTGLKDKNGTEVYEGDIVRCQKGCPHEVIWLKEYAGKFVGGMPAWYLSELSEGYSWSGEEEVIGNIYEHPHLLKEDN